VQRIIHAAYRDHRRIIQVPTLVSDHRRSRFNLLREGLYRFSRMIRLGLGV
jgi:hypothetical protein